VTAPRRIHLSLFASIPSATVMYLLSGAVVGISALPSALVIAWAVRALLGRPSAGHLVLFCLVGGCCLYLLVFCGLLVTGGLMRLLSLGVPPGTHRLFSAATAFWMAMNGVQAVAIRLFLPVVPGGYLPSMYYRIAGCRMGKDVWIVGATIFDPHLVSIGDGTVIGGDVVISPHIAGGGDVFFGPIRIGCDCRISAHSVICAGVTVEDGASVGIRTFLRRGTRVAAGKHVAALGGLPPRDVIELEKGIRHRK
jgi:hypothetical protein